MGIFVVSWLLHSYQWLWLRGEFPIRLADVLFWGIIGVAAGQIAISIFSLALDTLTANYVMRYPIRDLIRALAPTFLSTLGMTFALLALIRILPFSVLLEFILIVPAGVLIYFLMLWAVDRETVRAGIDLFRRTFMKMPVGAGSDA